MQTVFDWLSIVIFGGLALLFLQRSVEGESVGAMWKYLPAGILCAAANYFGNKGEVAVAMAAFITAVCYIMFVLKPIA